MLHRSQTRLSLDSEHRDFEVRISSLDSTVLLFQDEDGDEAAAAVVVVAGLAVGVLAVVGGVGGGRGHRRHHRAGVGSRNGESELNLFFFF